MAVSLNRRRADPSTAAAEPDPADRTGTDPDAVLAQSATENFPVALRILPAALREHLRAIYGYARLVDDLGDESPGDRSALLDAVAAEIDRLDTQRSAYRAGPGAPGPVLLDRLARTVVACDIPAAPLHRLIAANRRDQTVTRYATFTDLREYCRLSADPVGELVLHVVGRPDAGRIALSDQVCTALQLAEHWQDVAEDRGKGRIYLPREDMDRFGVLESDLDDAGAGPALRRLMAFEVDRAHHLLSSGAVLVGTLRGAARVAVAGYVAGGRAALRAIAAADYDVLAATPHAPHRAVAVGAVRVLITGGR